MKCSKCGTENQQGKSVCKKCGAFLYSANPNNRVPLTKEQKRQRNKAIIKGSALGCFWTGVVIVSMFIVLGILSYIFVRFILPEDLLEDMADPEMTETSENNDAQDADNDLSFILDDRQHT